MRLLPPNVFSQRVRRGPICALLLGFAAVTEATASSLVWAAGGFISDGDYGNASSTRIVAIPFSLKWRTTQWTVKANSAWIRVDGPGTVDVGSSGRSIARQDSGLGDTFLSASFRPTAIGHASGEVTARVKFPTANAEKGLGTGAMDFELRSDGYWAIGKDTIFCGVGYRWRGNSETTTLSNTATALAGMDWRVSSAIRAGSLLSGGQASTASAAPALDINAYGSWIDKGSRNYTLFVLKGLRKGSPDYGAGVQISW